MGRSQTLELGKEYPLPDETEDIQKIADISERQLRARYDREGQEVARRDQHPKNHGVIWADFVIEKEIPKNLQVGVFRKLGHTFPAWIRYSNGQKMDDSKGGSHGMAIKLMGVEGPRALDDEQAQTHDFVMIDHPVFFIRNIPDYIFVFEQLEPVNISKVGKPGSPIQALIPFFFPSVLPWRWRVREFKEFFTLGGIKKIIKPDSPLDSDYFSVTPYQLGEGQAVKFLVKPHARNKVGKVNQKDPNYLQKAMRDTLGDRDVGFDFYLQVQTDPYKMPIEDSTIGWDSPPIKVATIHVPKQVFDSDVQMEFCENLSFTPWHALAEQRPLGSMNRARKLVYQQTAKVRRELNRAHLNEPTPETLKPDLL